MSIGHWFNSIHTSNWCIFIVTFSFGGTKNDCQILCLVRQEHRRSNKWLGKGLLRKSNGTAYHKKMGQELQGGPTINRGRSTRRSTSTTQNQIEEVQRMVNDDHKLPSEPFRTSVWDLWFQFYMKIWTCPRSVRDGYCNYWLRTHRSRECVSALSQHGFEILPHLCTAQIYPYAIFIFSPNQMTAER